MLLAAGKSRRFGISDKLAEPFLGQPIGFHVVTALEAVPFAQRIAVVDGNPLDYAARGYSMILNDDPNLGMSRSVSLGVAVARAAGAESVVIALADMPRVTASQIFRLFERAVDAQAVVASSDGLSPRPPALFGSDHFDALEALTGDEGARALIMSGHHVVTMAAELVDIDTPEDIVALRVKYGSAGHRE